MPLLNRQSRRLALFAGLLIGALGLSACSGESDSPTPTPPPVDASIASVPLDEVVFDLFDGSYVPFPEASGELVEQMRDAIVPIYEPVYGAVEDGDWLTDRELVIGYVGDEKPYAYPVRMLNFHELVTDTIDDIPLLVTY